MAKKTVASLHEGSKEGRAYTKVIKMVKSPQTARQEKKEVLLLRLPKWLSLRKLEHTFLMNKWFRTKKYKTFSKNNRNSIYAITAKSSHWRTMRGFFIASFFTFPILCYIFVANVLYKQV